jgi:hypothetical protein
VAVKPVAPAANPDRSATRARPTLKGDISRGEGLLASGDFRARLRRIARKIAANPRQVGALLEGVDDNEHMSSEIKMCRKAIKILMEGKTLKESPVEVIPNPWI